MKKDIAAAVICVFMLLGVLGVSAADKYSNISDLGKDVVISGDFASLTLDYWNGRRGKIRFIAAAVNKNTGEIENIAVDEKDADNTDALHFSLNIGGLRTSADSELVFYLWDENQSSYVNCKPTGILEYDTACRAVENKISWSAPYDDNDAVSSYRIYDNKTGEFLFETSECYYIDGRVREISPNTEYEYCVVPIDSNGNAADREECETVAARTEEIYRWSEGEDGGVTPIVMTSNAREAYAEVVEKEGRVCLLAPSSRSMRDNAAAYNLTFTAGKMESQTPYSNIYVTVKYLDTDGGTLGMLYKYLRNDSGAYQNLLKEINGPRLTGTNEWKTYTFNISDPKAYLAAETGNLSNGQFALKAGKGYDLYVSEVTVVGEMFKFMPNAALGSVSDLNAVSNLRNVTLTWRAPQNAAEVKKYNIYDNAANRLIGESYTTEYTDGITRRLDEDTLYEYRVVPVDAEGMEGETSAQSAVSIKTKTTDVVNLRAAVSIGKIKLTWEALDSTGEYSRYRVYDDETDTLLAETEDLYYIDGEARELESGRLYSYRVVPVAANGGEASVSSLSKISATAPYDEVLNLTAETKIEEIKLAWEPVADTERYVKYRIYDTSKSDPIGETEELSYIDGRDRTLLPSTRYEYRIVPVESDGTEGVTSAASVIEATTKKVYSWNAEKHFNGERQGIFIQNGLPRNDSYFWKETVDGRTAAYSERTEYDDAGTAKSRIHNLYFVLRDENGNTIESNAAEDYTVKVIGSGGFEPDGGKLSIRYKTETTSKAVASTETLNDTRWQEYKFSLSGVYPKVENGKFSNSYFSIGNTNTDTSRFAIAEIQAAKTDELKFDD